MFICIKWVEWCKSAKKLTHLGPCFPSIHISLVKDQVTLKGIEEININISRVAKSSNSLKEETESVDPIHIYVRA